MMEYGFECPFITAEWEIDINVSWTSAPPTRTVTTFKVRMKTVITHGWQASYTDGTLCIYTHMVLRQDIELFIIPLAFQYCNTHALNV